MELRDGTIEVGKLYRVVPDEKAEAHGYIRVVYERSEDYGHTISRFFCLKSSDLWKKPYCAHLEPDVMVASATSMWRPSADSKKTFYAVKFAP